MPKEAVVASGPRVASKAGKITSVRIEPSDNGGYTVSCSREAKPKKGNSYPEYVPPSTFVFSDLTKAIESVEKMLGEKDSDD